MKSLSVVLPCLNEEEAIAAVLEKLGTQLRAMKDLKIISEWEVIAVNDGSTDSSAALLKQYDWIRTIEHSKPLGYGASLLDGFQAAKFDLIGFMDFDFTYDPEDFSRLVSRLEDSNIDIIFGNRLHKTEGMSSVRFFGNWIYARLVHLLYGHNLTDVCTGFRVFRRDLLPLLDKIKYSQLSFTTDFTTLVLKAGLQVGELDIFYHARKGQSKLNVLSDGFRFLMPIFLNRFRREVE